MHQPPDQHFLAVDLGAESGRVVRAGFAGDRVSLEVVHRFPNRSASVHGVRRWDVLYLWQEILAGLERAAEPKPAAVGVCTWGVDYGLLDAAGQPTGHPRHYRGRSEAVMAEAFATMSAEEIYRRTGIQFMHINTLYQWIADRAEVAAAETVLMMPDLLNAFLTGRVAAEYSICSTTQALDCRTRQWDADILRAFGLPRTRFPEVVPTGTVLGPVTDEVAATTGLAGVPVVATAGHDTAAAVAAVPVAADAAAGGWAYVSSGTWSLMGIEVPEPVVDDATRRDNFTNEGGVGGTVRLLKNIMGLWLIQGLRADFGGEYAELVAAAADAPPLRTVIDPDDPGFHSPASMWTQLQAYCRRVGQPVPDGPAAAVRCCLEGLALRYRKTLEQLEIHAGRRIDVIHVVGGGSRNALLNQWTADCTGRTVVAGPVEATALGNALVQAMALGRIASLADARQLVRRSFAVTTHQPQPNAAWDAAYAQFA